MESFTGSINQLISCFKQNNIWYNLTWNQEAWSCSDAANKRCRLGYIGIPLFDELKSNVGFYYKNGLKIYIVFHCRGNQLLDYNKINTLLGSDFKRLGNEDLQKLFQVEYGLVNPFILSTRFPEVEQIFDNTIFERALPPYTMMTNAGDRNWGIEFKPEELKLIFKKIRTEDIIEDATKFKFNKHKIGILTGNSPESGIHLWQMINSIIRKRLDGKFLGDLYFPTIIIESVPEMGLSMELDKRLNETLNVVTDGVTKLCESGATIVAVACNTTQYFSNEIEAICNRYNCSYASIADAIKKFLTRKNIQHFDLIGIKYVTDFDKWSTFQDFKYHYKIESPSNRILDEINELAFEVKKRNVSGKGITKLRNLLNNSTKTNNIIIALTELSILLESQKEKTRKGKLFIDTLSLLAQDIAEIYLNEINKVLQIQLKEYSI